MLKENRLRWYQHAITWPVDAPTRKAQLFKWRDEEEKIYLKKLSRNFIKGYAWSWSYLVTSLLALNRATWEGKIHVANTK